MGIATRHPIAADHGLQPATQVLQQHFDPQLHQQHPQTLLNTLIEVLYQHWYINADPHDTDIEAPFTDLAAPLRAAHAGSHRWQNGWKIERVAKNGQLIVNRHSSRKLLYPGDYQLAGSAATGLLTGRSLRIIQRNDSTASNPGYWSSFSSSWQQSESAIYRLYWNVDYAGAIALTRSISEILSDNIAWSFKVPIERDGYNRADTVVLYLLNGSFTALQPALKKIWLSVNNLLLDRTPRMARKLATGLALAENPLDAEESFGLYVCRQLAEAWLIGRQSEQRPAEQIMQGFRQQNIDPTRLYLNPGNSDNYQWE